jgi:hypothetical protein
MRIVPDQSSEEMASLFKRTLHDQFAEFGSDNKLTVFIEQVADWWLGDPENRGFKALERAISEEWGVEPLYIREVVSLTSWLIVGWFNSWGSLAGKGVQCKCDQFPNGSSKR